MPELEETTIPAQWAIVELMGHAQTAGKISFGNHGGLLRVDVPEGETYRTEFYGVAAIYAVKMVSEQIARAYTHKDALILEYNAPVITREQHQSVLERAEERMRAYRREIDELQRRLTAVNALPSGEEEVVEE